MIPAKADQRANRMRRGRTGGRPPGCDWEAYKQRNTVERGINPLEAAAGRRYPLRAECDRLPGRTPRRRHLLLGLSLITTNPLYGR